MQAIVVDDSRAMRTILGRFLRDAGYDVAEAGDGRAALTRLAELAGQPGVPSLALVDWNMPEMNGLEFVRAVRADAAYRDLRIVMVTSETEMERIVLALDAGADEYLMKPFTREAIFGKLELLGLAPSPDNRPPES